MGFTGDFIRERDSWIGQTENTVFFRYKAATPEPMEY